MEQRIKKCEVCKKEATCSCYKCMSYFCDACFKKAHEDESYKYHKQDKIDLYAPIDLKCFNHKLHPMDLFCVNEKGK